ncbi:hypothetical protein [Candidatus Methylacidithermus pantelleriae]|uniref:Uncharacterized protein n=1 Tax=Candidatus Methylacidithermus pantelleriae TaxID=2744239 RepID=A0A8J2FNV9_9BACT|nr:hypothetical protein [Candidatus Methylacidithermus pantelleriae]CAF0695761.1 hypothetical protein MPNT_20003 [Candidatus Methylacidithermus pantelleriae]
MEEGKSRWNLEALQGEGASVCRLSQEGSSSKSYSRDLPKDQQLWLTERSQVMEVAGNRVRYVIAGGESRASRERARRESRVVSAKEVLAEISKTIAQKADPVTVESPVGWALPCPQAHKYFGARGRP